MITKPNNKFMKDLDTVLQDPEVILVLNIIGAIKKSSTFIKNLRELLILKNSDYGNSALEPIKLVSNLSPIEGIRLRINDKLNRMICDKCVLPEDTVTDTAGYYVLLKILEMRDLGCDKSFVSEVELDKEYFKLVPSDYDSLLFQKFKSIQHQKLDTGVVVLKYFGSHIFTTDELVLQLPYPIPKGYLKGWDTNTSTTFRQYREYLETLKNDVTKQASETVKTAEQNNLCDDITMGDCLNRDSAGVCDICTNQSRFESRAEKKNKKRTTKKVTMKAEFTA